VSDDAFLVQSVPDVRRPFRCQRPSGDLRGLPKGFVGDQARHTAPTALSEAALVSRIQRGDSHAEDELVRRYARGVRIILTRSSRDRSMVDDLCQDVLRLAIEKIRSGSVREPQRLSGFIAGLARMRAIEHFRRQDIREAIQARNPVEAAAPANQLERMLERERADIARVVLAQLDSDRDREILRRYYINEDDKDAICADLGLTPLHFNRVLFRARQRYRELFQQRMMEMDGTARKPGGRG
jgi:RNA polymerase sigma-70 factor (ECF subfamily)